MFWFTSKRKNFTVELHELKGQIEELRNELQQVHTSLLKLEGELKQSIESRYTQLECLQGVYSLLPNLAALPPTRGWAASPDFLLKITELVLAEKPKFILELGTGVSTLVLNACIERNRNGKIISIDHDDSFLSATEDYLRVQGAVRSTTILHGPLKSNRIGDANWLWYDFELLSIDNEINMLIVDGPPRRIQKNSRYPAIPLLYSKFAKECKILLDDYKREDEQEIVKLWIRELTDLGFSVKLVEFLGYEKGLAILELVHS